MENKLSADILAALQSKKNVRVPFNTFRQIFSAKDDREFTSRLLHFSEANNLDYVIIIDPAGGPVFVRFWLKKVIEKVLPTISGNTASGISNESEEKEDAIHTKREP